MSDLDLIRWDAPGPYAVAFSTRRGGVSGTPFDTLNLGRLTGDDPANVAENRRRLCGELGTEPELLRYGKQVHGATVRRADGQGEPGDGLWTDAPGEPLLVFTADCLPIALARANGGAPAVAALHAGWRGLLAGIVGAAVAALGGGRLAAAIGPGIGPCCYEVGDEVAAPYRERFGADVVRDGRLDLWSAAERALRAAGVADVHRTDLCTACRPELFFSHRRDEGRTGRQGMVALVR
ncbi:MAG TPA: polyphenol oxidase family protein [Gaiellaceae bacterium]|nr:polyphenol oxidase family protein [Gaiellaceae bacterium]